MPPPGEGIAARFVLGPALRTQPDRRLVTLVREGYESAFEEIVRRYGKPLSRYAAAIVGGRSEDVTQDAFSKALLALRRGDAEIELRPWLFRIVRNTALNDLRDSPPAPEVLAEAIAGGRNPAEELERREELSDLMKRLQALPEPQRAAIVMRELEGLGHEEIAAALGLSGGAARQAIYRARRALRDGAGMLIPLPLLQALLAGSGSGAAEAAAGATGIGSAAGVGVALKATAATVLVAGAVGAGVAIKDHPHSGNAKATTARAQETSADDVVSVPVTTVPRETGSDNDDHRGRGEPERGDDHGGQHGNRPSNDRGGREAESGDDRGGQSGGPGPGDDHQNGENGTGDDHGAVEHGGGSGDDHGGSGHGGGSGSGHDERSGSSRSGSGGGSGSGSGKGGSGASEGSESSGGSSGGGSGPSGGGGPEPSEEPSGGGDSGSSDGSSGGENSGSESGSGSGGESSDGDGGGDLN